MNSFYSAEWENIFLLYINNSTTHKIKIFSDSGTYCNGDNGDIQSSLKVCIQNFKTSLKNIKI